VRTSYCERGDHHRSQSSTIAGNGEFVGIEAGGEHLFIRRSKPRYRIPRQKREGELKGLALFAITAISLVCAANQSCSQRTTDDHQAAEAMAGSNATASADLAKEQYAELMRLRQSADTTSKQAPTSEPDYSATDAATCQQTTLYWGSIAQARDNGVPLDKVLRAINDRTAIPGEFDPYIEAMARQGRTEECKNARYIYKHREISPVKFQDRAYRECVERDRRDRLKARKEKDEELRLPGI
jgi:hypothetical protein